MDTSDFELYKGKTFASLCKDIVTNAEEKKTQLDVLITDLREMIKTINDAVTIVPLLKEYFDVSVRNDEQLIKLAAIIQRMIAGKASDGENGSAILTEDERKQLMTVVEETAKKMQEPDSEKIK